MAYRVLFDPAARADLNGLYSYIRRQSESPAVAGRYARRIVSHCMALRRFPHRGTRRDDLSPGLRIIGFERRVTIIFAVAATEVLILRILYGGRDVDDVGKT